MLQNIITDLCVLYFISANIRFYFMNTKFFCVFFYKKGHFVRIFIETIRYFEKNLYLCNAIAKICFYPFEANSLIEISQ